MKKDKFKYIFLLFIFIFNPKTYAQDTTLLLHYDFNETSGSTVIDKSGNGFDAILVNNPERVPGVHGNALRFNGSNNYVINTNIVGLPIGNAARTMTFWVKASHFKPGVVFAGYGATSFCKNFQFGYSLNGGTKLSFYGWSACDYSSTYSSSALANNIFHHLAVVYNGSQLLFYVNGSLKSSTNRILKTLTSTLCIGGEVNGNNCDRLFDGSIDDFRIYSRALSENEIQDLARLEEPIPSNEYQLQASVNGGGGITGLGINCGTDCIENYLNDSTVTLTALSDGGYVFNGWSGSCSGVGDCILKMNSDKNVIANFSLAPIPLPPAPTQLSATQITTSSISLDWNDVSQADSYVIKRNGVVVATPTSSTHSDLNLNADTAYQYSVFAVNFSSGQSVNSIDKTFTTLAESIPPATTGDPSLVVHYDFDGHSGSTVFDKSGKGNHLSLVNSPTWVSGVNGNAVQFNGISNYGIKTGLSGLPKGNAARTMAFWVKDSGSESGVVFAGYGATSFCKNFQLGYSHSDGKNLSFYGWSACDYASNYFSSGLTNNVFHHLAVVYTGSQLLFYVDGSLKSSTSRYLKTLDSTLCIGGEVNGNNCDRLFDGSIDDFRIYNRALSASEVAFLMQTIPSTGDTTPPQVPNNFNTTNIDIHSISVAWDSSSDLGGGVIKGYRIYRNGSLHTTLNSSTLSYTDVGLSANTTYQYHVSAFDNSGNESAFSVALTETTQVDSSPPPTGAVISFDDMQTVLSANKGTGGVGVGDLDGDGRDEFIADKLKIFKWNGSSWVIHTVTSTEGKQDRFAGDNEVLDVDNDGYLDIIITDSSNTGTTGQLLWYKNPNGNLSGTWTEHVIYSWNGSSDSNRIRHCEEEVGDVNNDGYEDIVVRDIRFGTWVFINKKDGTFNNPKYISHNPREGLALADLDKDGDLDIVINGVWFETPADPVNGNYHSHPLKGMEAWYPSGLSNVEVRDYAAKVRVADINEDGRIDIIISNSEELNGNSPNKPHGVHVYLQPNDLLNDSWNKVTLDSDHFSWHSLKVADVNNDGHMDVVAAISTVGVDNAPAESKVWQGQGDGTFLNSLNIGNTYGYQGELGDYDGDGFLDFFLPYAFNSGSIIVYRNTSH